MTSTTQGYPTSNVINSGINYVDALQSGTKWGNSVEQTVLTYSFPWTFNTTAVFSAPNGSVYSSSNEHLATQHFGLDSAAQAAVRLALGAWSSIANVRFVEVADTATDVGDLRFAFSSAVDPWWGWASYPNDYWPSGGDVWINPDYASEAWGVGTYNYEALMHEIGHTLGLKHPFEDAPVLPTSTENTRYSIMSYTDPEDDIYPSAGYVDGQYQWLTYRINMETPMVYDIAAIQHMYGANKIFNSGDDVYEFNQLNPFFMTLWDGGGEDELRLVNFNENCILDLRPGSYSSLRFPAPAETGGAVVTYQGDLNLGIAYGCVIENATGGAGDDVFFGNQADNKIDGGSSGYDIFNFTGYLTDYSVTYFQSTDKFVIADKVSVRDGTDSLTGIDAFAFADSLYSRAQMIQMAAVVTDDTVAPTVISFNPTDESNDVTIGSNIVVTFSEAIARGTGSIVLKTVAGAVVESYDAASSGNLSFSGSTLTINPSIDLAAGTTYKVEFAAGSIKDLADNAYAGTTSYNFSTILSANLITGTSGNDTLTGTAANDEIDGLAGNDNLDGKAGNDTMSGGKGNDTYRVSDSGDTVTELTGEGTDLVNSDLAAYTLAANVENGRIMRTDAADLTGNTLKNTLYAGAGDNVLDGATGSDTVSYTYATAAVTVNLSLKSAQITKGSGTDTLLNVENLTGSRYNDALTGNASANTLDGGYGADVIQGLQGNDILIGGSGNDTLSGGDGNDILKGGAGNDQLSGDLGKDSFVFDTTLSAISNRDTITDFNVIDDSIRLENNIFKKLTKTGTLSNDHFASNIAGVAQDADDYIIYESDSGVLAYDADGNGAGAAIQFAIIGINLSLTAADFTVI